LKTGEVLKSPSQKTFEGKFQQNSRCSFWEKNCLE
jgi:hypothetical protein